MIDRATVTMRELFGKVREGVGRDYLTFGILVLPRSRTPLWSYTPRCICSWFSEGRGMGQRVILLKTIQGRERETGRDGQREEVERETIQRQEEIEADR